MQLSAYRVRSAKRNQRLRFGKCRARGRAGCSGRRHRALPSLRLLVPGRKWEVGETALKQATALVGRDPDAVCCPFRCPLASFVAARETRNLRTSDFLRLRDKDSNLDYLIQSQASYH